MQYCAEAIPSSNANGQAISFNFEYDHNVGTREFGQCASSSPLALRRPSSRSARLSSSTAFNVPPTRRTRPRRFAISTSDDVVGDVLPMALRRSHLQGQRGFAFFFAAGHEELVAVLSAAAPALLIATRLGAGTPVAPWQVRRVSFGSHTRTSPSRPMPSCCTRIKGLTQAGGAATAIVCAHRQARGDDGGTRCRFVTCRAALSAKRQRDRAYSRPWDRPTYFRVAPRQNLPAAQNISDATIVMRLRELVRSQAVRSALEHAR
jgi:hypothetical protein